MSNYEQHIDPLHHDALAASLDETHPNWREQQVDPEERATVSYWDVKEADNYSVHLDPETGTWVLSDPAYGE
jgi:hypothetical protein